MDRRARGLAAALAGIALAGPAVAAPRLGPAECRAGPARAEILDGPGPRGEIRLATGTAIVLDSLRWPDAADEAPARAWVAARRGARLTVVPRGEPDRWGRLRADAQVEGPVAGADSDADAGADLAGGLVGAGLAYADAGEADTLCRPALLAVEAAARGLRRGVWQAAPPAALDGPALRALEGRFAVVEGHVRHVGERAARTYLDFAPRGGDGLTVIVSKRTWRTMRARGLSAAALEGRRVRVRGVLEVRRGPTVEATVAEAIEVLTDAAPSGPGPSGERGARR